MTRSMRPLLRALLALGLGVCAAFLVACGESNGLLAPNDASGVNGGLDAVSAAVADHRCAAAGRASVALQQEVARLPLTVDQKLRASLAQGASTVAARAAADCAKTTKTTTTTVPTTTTTDTTTTQTTESTATTTPTTTTATTPTTTVPTTTTPTTTTPTTTTPTPTLPGGAGPGGGGATTP
jgi:hypothetical protein